MSRHVRQRSPGGPGLPSESVPALAEIEICRGLGLGDGGGRGHLSGQKLTAPLRNFCSSLGICQCSGHLSYLFLFLSGCLMM